MTGIGQQIQYRDCQLLADSELRVAPAEVDYHKDAVYRPNGVELQMARLGAGLGSVAAIGTASFTTCNARCTSAWEPHKRIPRVPQLRDRQAPQWQAPAHRISRLTDRGQPQLATWDMMNWSRYLREEAHKAGCEILDTGALTVGECLERLTSYM
jgi:hypothetical protein